jgi:Skp family chaperone for outer membrane proteins
MNKLAGLALLGTLITLTGCEDAKEVKEETKEKSAQMQEKLGDAWNEVKETTHDLKNDESLNELLQQSKAMSLDMYDDGKEIAIDAWIKSKEAAGELTEKTKQKAQEIADEIEQAREEHSKGE